MKKLILFTLIFSVFLCMYGRAQNTRDGKISDKSTFAGKRQLRKEKRIHNNAVSLTASNERLAKRRNAKGGLQRSSRKPVKHGKNKDKGKAVVIEDKKLASAEPKKE